MATAYVIFKDMRVTLAVLFVRPEDPLPELVAALLRRLRISGLKIKRLYFDKGFCTRPVLRYVEKSGWPAILACPIRGKKGGTRGLCHGSASYQTTHTFKAQQYGAYTAPVTVARTYTSHKRSKRKGRRARWLVFVVLNALRISRAACAMWLPSRQRQPQTWRATDYLPRSGVGCMRLLGSAIGSYRLFDFAKPSFSPRTMNQMYSH